MYGQYTAAEQGWLMSTFYPMVENGKVTSDAARTYWTLIQGHYNPDWRIDVPPSDGHFKQMAQTLNHIRRPANVHQFLVFPTLNDRIKLAAAATPVLGHGEEVPSNWR